MANSGSTALRGIAGAIAGLGSIYLAVEGVIAPEAATAILSALIAFFVGEVNGRRAASA